MSISLHSSEIDYCPFLNVLEVIKVQNGLELWYVHSRPSRGRSKLGDGTWPPIILDPSNSRFFMDIQISRFKKSVAILYTY
jgi:hypothetical protein